MSLPANAKQLVGDAQALSMEESSYEKELQVAKAFLCTKGFDEDNLKLLRFKLEFQDNYTTCFRGLGICILVANSRFHDILGNPVLAWSKESPSTYIRSTADINGFLSYYERQLKAIDENPSIARKENEDNTSYRSKKKVVEPILGKICFSQNHPYNLLSPTYDNKKTLIGCIPTACAQIMAHYKYPIRGKGSVAYLSGDKTSIISKDFSTVHMDWDNYGRDSYSGRGVDSMSIKYISNLMISVSASLFADFKDASTSAYYNKVKPAMMTFWGYSPDCQCLRLVNRDTIVGLIHRELDEGRITLAGDDHHGFLVDGCDGDFLHFNLGWGGESNGYYRTSLVKNSTDYPIRCLVIGLRPDDNADRRMTIELKKPNTLRSLLAEDDKMKLKSLTISGVLGNDDIVLLRQMLGAQNSSDVFEPIGILTELDLTEAKFKTDRKAPYRIDRIPGFASRLRGSWSDFVAAGNNIQEGTEIVFRNGEYYRQFHVESGIISPYMFADCTNLKKMRLPKNTQVVCAQAFLRCSSLTDIILGEKVEKVADYAFGSTILLERVKTVKLVIPEFGKDVFHDGYYGAKLKLVKQDEE